MTDAEVGTMYGPYIEDGKYKIAKLLDVADLPDSIKYSQLFVPAPNGDFDKVKPFVDSLKAMRNEYVMAIFHTAINITRDTTGDELSMRPEYEVISDESTGRVDFAIKVMGAQRAG